MRFLHVLKRKKLIFLNIFLFSYILINFFDGERGFISYTDKKQKKQELIIEKQNLEKKLIEMSNSLENKIKLLSGNVDPDYVDILYREKLKFGNKDEIIIKLK